MLLEIGLIRHQYGGGIMFKLSRLAEAKQTPINCLPC